MEEIQFIVTHPGRWWLAAKHDLPGLVDPDLADRRIRYADRGTIKWADIAGVVSDAGRRIASGDLFTDEDGETLLKVAVPTAFSDAEVRIVLSWLGGGQVPMEDPWVGEHGEPPGSHPTDGRHRLWCSWEAAPDALLPIRSDTLGYLDEEPKIRAMAIEQAKAGLLNMDADCRTRSPLFVRTIQELGS